MTESCWKDSVINALSKSRLGIHETAGALYPQEWTPPDTNGKSRPELFSYASGRWHIPQCLRERRPNEVFLQCAETVFNIDQKQISELLEQVTGDVLTIHINAARASSLKEVVRLTPDNHVIGFQRRYGSVLEPVYKPKDWPALTCFRKKAWKKILSRGVLETDFSTCVEWLRREGFCTEHFQMSGDYYQLERTPDLLAYFQQAMPPSSRNAKALSRRNRATLVPPVWTGKDVRIASGAIVIGPAFLSNQVTVESGVVIRGSIVGPNITIPKNKTVDQSVCLKQSSKETKTGPRPPLTVRTNPKTPADAQFRQWPFFSYARFGKRLFDILAASIMLILLIPLFPIFIIMAKWKSPGPSFYRAGRQGLWGEKFDCLKFRSMMLQAEKMQFQLQMLNQVDGPQFKIENDPRISCFGKFLRDTYIDELPQFINVLLGQMSIVGPRPSPEHENESCPMWRDARLSVRPGITGLWQLFRTRQESVDFQEWIHYDIEYVRTLSFRKDVWICLKTAQKLINNFLNQFG